MLAKKFESVLRPTARVVTPRTSIVPPAPDPAQLAYSKQ